MRLPCRAPVWAIFLAVGAALSGLYFAPGLGPAQTPLDTAIGVAAALAIALAARGMKPHVTRPWLLLAASQLAFAVGDALLGVHFGGPHSQLGVAPLADGSYVLGYGLAAVGLVELSRRQKARDLGALIDACIFAVAIGLALWVGLVGREPASGIAFADRLFSIAYPALDVLLLGLVVRLALTGTFVSNAFRLLGAAIVLLLVGDVVLGVARLDHAFATGGVADLTWLLSYVCFGAAALHPSAGHVADASPRDNARLTRMRRGLLLCAGAVPPVLLLVNLGRGGSVHAIALGGVAIVALVVWRFALYAGAEMRASAGERSLRHAAAELAGAVDSESIAAATLGGVIGLLPDALEVRVNLLRDGDLHVVAAAGENAGQYEGFTAPFDSLAEQVRTALLEHRAVDLQVDDTLHVLIRTDAKTRVLGIYPLLLDEEHLSGWIVVGTARPMSARQREGLYHLLSLASVALERAELVVQSSTSSRNAWFEAVVRESWDIITIVEPDGTIRWLTPSVERTLGYPVDALVGGRLADLLHPGDAPEIHDLLGGDWLPMPEGPVRARLRTAAGEYHTVDLLVNDLRLEPGVHGVIVTARDITAQEAPSGLDGGAAWADRRAS